jgi:hypothetical protein
VRSTNKLLFVLILSQTQTTHFRLRLFPFKKPFGKERSSSTQKWMGLEWSLLQPKWKRLLLLGPPGHGNRNLGGSGKVAWILVRALLLREIQETIDKVVEIQTVRIPSIYGEIRAMSPATLSVLPDISFS